MRIKVGGKFKFGNLKPEDKKKIAEKFKKKGININVGGTSKDTLCDKYFGKGKWAEGGKAPKKAVKITKEDKKAIKKLLSKAIKAEKKIEKKNKKAAKKKVKK